MWLVSPNESATRVTNDGTEEEATNDITDGGATNDVTDGGATNNVVEGVVTQEFADGVASKDVALEVASNDVTEGVALNDEEAGEDSTDGPVGEVVTVDAVVLASLDDQERVGSEVDPEVTPDDSETLCAICLCSIALLSVRTSCRHAYCCACLMTYWRHQAQLARMKCPTCRAAVSSLDLAVGEGQEGDNQELVQAVHCYNMRFSSSPKPVGQHARNLVLLLGCCLCEFFSERGLIWMFWLRLVIVFLSLCVGLLSLLDIGTVPRDAIMELDVMVDRVYLCLLFVVYCSILIRRNLGRRRDLEVM